MRRNSLSLLPTLLLATIFLIQPHSSRAEEPKGAKENAETTETTESSKDPELVKAYELLNSDRMLEAKSLLIDRLAKHRKFVKTRALLAQIHAHNGELEQGVKVLEAGMTEGEAEAELLWYIGRFRFQQGEDGPNCIRAGGTVQYSPSKMTDEEEAAWSKARFAESAAAWKKFRTVSPDHLEGAEESAKALSAWKDKAGISELEQLNKQFPESQVINQELAKAFAEQGQGDRALALVEKLLKGDPRKAALHSMHADVLKKLKRTADAELAADRAAFFEVIPSFCALPFSAESKAILEAVREHPKNCRKYLAKVTDQSSELLALICFMHISHGPVEDACFAELTKRKREDLLLAMTNENCQCICTFRGAARGLARLKSPKAFDLLERLLPHDTNPVFYTEAAESLATLGDIRSVPLLIETMAPNFKEADRPET